LPILTKFKAEEIFSLLLKPKTGKNALKNQPK